MAAHTHRFIRWRASRFRALDDDFFGPRNGSGVRSQHPTGSPCSATVTLAARERLDDAGGITASEKHGVQLRVCVHGVARSRLSHLVVEVFFRQTSQEGGTSVTRGGRREVRRSVWFNQLISSSVAPLVFAMGYPFQPAILLESCCKRRAQSCASNIVGLKCKWYVSDPFAWHTSAATTRSVVTHTKAVQCQFDFDFVLANANHTKEFQVLLVPSSKSGRNQHFLLCISLPRGIQVGTVALAFLTCL
ncbi:hypothetical protein B0H11DRAFT_1942467 [Mycena galericulata]|nr:hypothetical protein B0H11DRAFT_1942467 [Mycena galericulata]